jgi:hypothetical protein
MSAVPKQKLVVNSKTETPRAPVTARAPAEPGVLTPSGELTAVPGRPGNAASASIHAALLQRTTAAQPSSARQSLLQLQQQYGNRYVQRVLALAREGASPVETTPEVEQSIQRARGGGQALDEGVRTKMESALGADFSGVRIHADAQADSLNCSLQARAFTTGRDIFFRQGAYNPGSSSGRELLAHELTHVVQQSGGAVQPKLMVNAPGDRFEQEADHAARLVMQHEQQPAPAPAQARLAQRQVEDEDEAVQTRRVQRQAEEDEESLQMQSVQRQAEEDEESVQLQSLQRQAEEDEDSLQMQSLQRQMEEDEESLQTQRVQRQVEEEEEPVQLRRLQRQAMEDEEPIQPSLIQRQAAPAAEMAAEEAEPTEAEKAAALAAARAAEQIAEQARSEAANEVDKSRAAQAGEQQAGQAAQQEAEAKAPATPVEAAYALAAQIDGKEAKAGGGAADEKRPGVTAVNGAGPAAGGGARPMATNGAGPGAVNGKAPTAPEEDADFQTVLERIKRVAAKQQAHAPATAKASEAQAAAESPPAELESQAQATQVDEMEQVEPPAFDAAAFKAQLLERIAALAPRTAEEADNFKKENKLAGVKADMQGKVQEEQSASQAPLEEKTAAAPDTSQVEPKAVEPLLPSEPGPHPPNVGATAAAPKSKGQSEVELPLHENSGQLDQQMAEAGVSEGQLEESHESEFETALASKREAQTHAQEAPQEYRQAEQEQLTEAETDAAVAAQARTEAMHGDRAQLLGQVESQQGQAKGQDEQARAKIAADIEQIYEETKTNVETILSELDGKVEQAFDEGATAAKQVFEEYVAAKMNAYKERRYGGWLGWARWAKDKLLGMPAEVNAFYAEGRQLYLQKMDAVIDNVVAIVGTSLSEAKAEIANGQQRIQTYVEQLPDDLKAVGQEAAENIQSKFDDLEQSVNDKQNELIDTLANKYQENLQAVDARIEELKAANQGLVDKAINAVAGVIKTILKLKDMLLSVLAKIAEVVVKIIKAPVKFLGNLVQGIRQGFDKFLGRIGQHLQTGLVAWLTGALGSLSIRVPDDIFSLPGIFSLVVQVLGLTWDYIRSKAVKLLGEPVVKALETGFEIFQILMRDGPLGLWQFVKEQFSDLKKQVIEQIESMVITEVIKAGVKWILGLLNPVGAFVKAAMGIYEIVKFFVERGSQVIEMVNAFIDAVAAIAGGAVGGAAKLVEDALAKALPVVIGFLASLLGISGLAKRVQEIIQRVRKRIDKAIDGLILRARKFAQKLLKREKRETGKSGEAIGGKAAFAAAGETHTVWTERRNGKVTVMVASEQRPGSDHLARIEKNVERIAKQEELTELIPFIIGLITQIKAEISKTEKHPELGAQKERLAKLLADLYSVRITFVHGTSEQALGNLNQELQIKQNYDFHDFGYGFYLGSVSPKDIKGAEDVAKQRTSRQPGAVPIIAETQVKLGDLGEIADLRPGGTHRARWDRFLAGHPTLVQLFDQFTLLHKRMEEQGTARSLTIPKPKKPADLFYQPGEYVKREEIVKEFLLQNFGTAQVTIIGDVIPGAYTGETQTVIRSPDVLKKMKFRTRVRLEKGK